MSVSSFFVSVEDAATKVAAFIVKEATAAETLLGAKTGSAKLNIVITAVSAALSVVGINAATVQSELTSVVNALIALFNKAGIFPSSGSAPSAPPAK